jgi:hypothetical protein
VHDGGKEYDARFTLTQVQLHHSGHRFRVGH